MKFNTLPRVRLASLPTPIQFLPNLTEELDGPKIWVKRDDLSWALSTTMTFSCPTTGIPVSNSLTACAITTTGIALGISPSSAT